MNENEKPGMQINIDPETSKGKYSNLAIIAHTPVEFVVDFASNLPGSPQPQIVSRIIMTPFHAKRLLTALADNVAKYEGKFGPIDAGGTINVANFIGKGSKS